MDLGDLFGGLDADDAKKLLRLAKGLPDEALGLLGELPGVLKKLGDGLAQAGEQAGKAAGALVGDDGKGGAKQALANGATTLTAAKDQLTKAAELLSGVASDFTAIAVPTVEPTFTKVAGLSVVSGVDVGSSKPLEGPAKRLSEGAKTVTGVAGDMDSLSGSLRELSDILGTVGEALQGLGTRLDESGGSVRSLVG
ncbi:MAG: hypothetical protein ACRDT6_14250 [Micromonosporaceae bacterium]